MNDSASMTGPTRALDRAIRFVATEAENGRRLDVVLAERLQGYSRTYLKTMVKSGAIVVDGAVAKPSHVVVVGRERAADRHDGVPAVRRERDAERIVQRAGVPVVERDRVVEDDLGGEEGKEEGGRKEDAKDGHGRLRGRREDGPTKAEVGTDSDFAWVPSAPELVLLRGASLPVPDLGGPGKSVPDRVS